MLVLAGTLGVAALVVGRGLTGSREPVAVASAQLDSPIVHAAPTVPARVSPTRVETPSLPPVVEAPPPVAAAKAPTRARPRPRRAVVEVHAPRPEPREAADGQVAPIAGDLEVGVDPEAPGLLDLELHVQRERAREGVERGAEVRAGGGHADEAATAHESGP